MRIDIKKVAAYIIMMFLVVTIFTSFLNTTAYASGLELTGNDKGLTILPKDACLFELDSMEPGQTVSSRLTIENNYEAPFELFMRAERASEEIQPGEADLYKQIQLKVDFRNKVLFDGSMYDFASSEDGISLGEFSPKELQELTATAYLPGEETGNEFQGKSLDTRWVFTATSPGITHLPKTGSGINGTLSSVLGLVVIVTGSIVIYTVNIHKN